MKLCRKGEIVHIHKFIHQHAWDDGSELPVGDDAWAVVEIDQTEQRYLDIDFVRLPADSAPHSDPLGWQLDQREDKWTVVPEKRVPDHVWASLAVLRMTGEIS